MDAMRKLKEPVTQKFKFILHYKLKFEKCELYKLVFEEDFKKDHPIKSCISDICKIHLDKNGTVAISYVVQEEDNTLVNIGTSQFTILVSVFHADGT